MWVYMKNDKHIIHIPDLGEAKPDLKFFQPDPSSWVVQ